MTLFFDSDGVLMDFETPANAHLGMYTRDYEKLYGSDKFWEKIGEVPDFFNTLPLLPDAMKLYNACKHLNPVILTGAPSQLGEAARVQKFRAAERYFGVHQRIIVCQSKNKAFYCQPGDTIVDDWRKHQKKWEDAGGNWVHHESADSSIEQLRKLGYQL